MMDMLGSTFFIAISPRRGRRLSRGLGDVYKRQSWSIMETSTENNGLPFTYLLKTVMLLMPFLLAIQGFITVKKNLIVLYRLTSKAV